MISGQARQTLTYLIYIEDEQNRPTLERKFHEIPHNREILPPIQLQLPHRHNPAGSPRYHHL